MHIEISVLVDFPKGRVPRSLPLSAPETGIHHHYGYADECASVRQALYSECFLFRLLFCHHGNHAGNGLFSG